MPNLKLHSAIIVKSSQFIVTRAITAVLILIMALFPPI